MADTKTDERSIMGSGSPEAQAEALAAARERVGEEVYDADPEQYWTAQHGSMPSTGQVLANEPQQFLPEQLPDPEAAQEAGVPEITIPEAQINEDAIGHPNGPEPGEVGRIAMSQDVKANMAAGDPDAEDEEEEVAIEDMTKQQLQDYADANGIEGVSMSMSKDEMLAAVQG